MYVIYKSFVYFYIECSLHMPTITNYNVIRYRMCVRVCIVCTVYTHRISVYGKSLLLLVMEYADTAANTHTDERTKMSE